jgi:thiaminase
MSTVLSEALTGRYRALWDELPQVPWLAAFTDGTLTGDQLANWAGQYALLCQMEGDALREIRKRLTLIPAELGPFVDRLIDDSEREPEALGEMLEGMGLLLPGEPAPVCRASGDYVNATANSPDLSEAITALYGTRAARLHAWTQVRDQHPDNPPSEWMLRNWTRPAFQSTVIGVGACLNRVAGIPTLENMTRLGPIFHQVLRYEWMFWQMAFTGEVTWPV